MTTAILHSSFIICLCRRAFRGHLNGKSREGGRKAYGKDGEFGIVKGSVLSALAVPQELRNAPLARRDTHAEEREISLLFWAVRVGVMAVACIRVVASCRGFTISLLLYLVPCNAFLLLSLSCLLIVLPLPIVAFLPAASPDYASPLAFSRSFPQFRSACRRKIVRKCVHF